MSFIIFLQIVSSFRHVPYLTTFINKMILNINIFSVLVIDQILNKSNVFLIVGIDNSSSSLRIVELSKESYQPYGFLYSI